MTISGRRTVALLGELIALENRLSRGYGDKYAVGAAGVVKIESLD
jgi:hypothetical protein